MQSKEEKVLGLFFEEPNREWHFEEILKEAQIARSKAVHWLKKFIRNGIIKRVKERAAMPYYIGNFESLVYKNKKKLFALAQLYNSGFIDHLCSLKNAKTIILFGSFVRSDWYKNSDIDIFIYGEPTGLKIAKYEMKLMKDIQVFVCREKNDLLKIGAALLKNILKGNLVKGDINFVKVSVNA